MAESEPPSPFQYQYLPLQTDPPQIRLLTLWPGERPEPLECDIASFTIRNLIEQKPEPLKWEALSYFWGDYTKLRPLQIGDKILNITENLYVALEHLRLKDAPRHIWIDQICVNQKDLVERGWQVQQMDRIYKNATRVIAWLGQGDPSSILYMRVLKAAQNLIEQGLYPAVRKPSVQEEALLFAKMDPELAFDAERRRRTHDETRLYLASLCRDFCRNPWFKRIWIVQEAVLNRNLTIQYGLMTVDWTVHSNSVLELLWADLITPGLSGSGVSLTDTIHMLKDEHWSSTRRELFSLFNALKHQQTTEPRDRVYALLGLAASEPPPGRNVTPTPFMVDYNKSTVQLSKDLTLWYIKNEGTLDILSICCLKENTFQESSGLPTWTINLDLEDAFCDRLFSSELRTLDAYNVGTGRELQSRYIPDVDALILSGVEFDTVAEVSNTSHSQELFKFPDSETWTEWRNIALKAQPDDPYRDIEGRTDAFWRTVICNQMWDNDEFKYIKAPARLGDQYRRWSSAQGNPSNAETPPGSSSQEFLTNLMIGNQARLFRTRRGYLGLACEHVRPDDKVVVLWGGHLPCIFRECGKDAISVLATDGESGGATKAFYRLVGGQIYLQGIMEGEGIRLAHQAGFQEREFWIV